MPKIIPETPQQSKERMEKLMRDIDAWLDGKNVIPFPDKREKAA